MRLAAIAGVVAVGVAAGGCAGTSASAPKSSPSVAGMPAEFRTTVPSSSATRHGPPWQQHAVLHETTVASVADQSVSPGGGILYALVSKTSTVLRGPWVLGRVDLQTGSALWGPALRVGGLTLAAGYLWAYGGGLDGPAGMIGQFDPATLTRVRGIRLPPVPGRYGGQAPAIAAGSDGSVWIGSYRTVLQVSTATGRVLTRITLHPGLEISDLALSPAGHDLYLSAAHVDDKGGMSGLVMLEYDTRAGRLLTTTTIRYSVAGAELTAVAGGVWVSFRTGMLGITIHLGQRGLRMITPPGPGVALGPIGVFHWGMDATTSYDGGDLWMAQALGLLACLNPQTGQVRASERVYFSRLIAIIPAAHAIFALSNSTLLRIRPPRRCWR